EPASVGEARETDPFGAPEVEEYDPWEPFNEWTFAFNYKLDRYVMKPAAKAWIWAVPEVVRQSLGSAFSNLDTPRRLVNNLLQRKVGGAAREGIRIASTVNERAENLETFQDAEESTIDLYGAVRNGYLQRRRKAILE